MDQDLSLKEKNSVSYSISRAGHPDLAIQLSDALAEILVKNLLQVKSHDTYITIS